VRRPPWLILIALSLAAAGCGAAAGDARRGVAPPAPATESGSAHHFDLRRIATGINRPTYVGAAPGDRALWALEQPGRVVRIDGGRRTTVLDLTSRVKVSLEQGLLGMAFHPDFATNGRLYLHWSDREGDTRVAEFQSGPRGIVDPAPRRRLLHVEQPDANHNGGQLAFGPDGRLYLGLGDGGGAFDPRRTAQDPGSLLGKISSIDVDAPLPRWRVEVTGLRNPWRFSFDTALSEIWIADVGQDQIEEVDRVRLHPGRPPQNLGWSAYEGTREVEGRHELDLTGELVWPVAQYTHRDGCSITGGLVYRGTRIRGLARRYVFGDFCTGALWSLRGTPGGQATDMRRERPAIPQLTHIGADADGELLLASATGSVYRAVPAAGR
jgi:glucose/arabinose dehydrogenase